MAGVSGFWNWTYPQGELRRSMYGPSLAGRGIGTTLLVHAERMLLEEGKGRVEIEASLVLYERLLRRGWESHGEQWVERSGERLQRYRLSKSLSAIET